MSKSTVFAVICNTALLLCLLSAPLLMASGPEEPNSIQASRIEESPEIDGYLDDDVWRNMSVFYSGNFTQTRPNNGAVSSERTEIKVAYNDYSIYVAAKLYDRKPQQILQEFGIRDSGERNSDMFAFAVDTYNKQQNAFVFMVSAAGVQTDLFITPNGDDTNWNAVWKSGVQIQEDGWTVELEIPYSALRFAEQEEQKWGVNFMRVIKRKQEQSFWSHVDASVNGIVNQFGTLNGIRDIQPPLRLQLTPYISGYVVNNTDGEWSSSVNGGMDLKLGLSESFTLDMSLVPDFGQVVADNVVFNLSPFEVQFSENRPFFTEGTELFDRGGMFYSRRIGQSFASEDDVKRRYLQQNPRMTSQQLDGLEIDLPGEGVANTAPLVNVTKISGRTKNGLGLGFFNGITNATYASVIDPTKEGSDQQSQVLADPFTNFNVFVIDQNLKNNSNIGLINTNVTRWNGGDDANATALDFRLNDKKNEFGVRGFGAYNRISRTTLEDGRFMEDGFKYFLEAGKYSGKWQYRLSRNVESDDYNIRDLGFLRAPNEISHRARVSYNIFKPVGKILRLRTNLNFRYQKLFKPNVYANSNVSGNIFAQFKNFFEGNIWQEYNFQANDYFEPRTDDFSMYLNLPWSHAGGIWFGTDSRKKFRLGASAGMWRRPDWNQFDNWLNLNPRFRVNDKLSFDHSLNFTRVRKERGYVWDVPEEFNPGEERIPFGTRERRDFVNTFSANYIFTNMMGINLRVRHYWSNVWYDQDKFFFLEESGQLEPMNNGYTGKDLEGNKIHDINFNAFNVDLSYSWQFAPGSMMTIVWKQSIYDDNTVTDKGFGENFRDTWRAPQTNSLSVRVLYFLDYIDFRKVFRSQTMRSAQARSQAGYKNLY